MPETVTVPDVLKGHAADIWRSAFLSSYDGTCKERGDKRDSCAASIAWAAVKNVYRKNDKGEWVEKAADPVMEPGPAPMNVAEFPTPMGQVEQTTKKDPWLEAFMEALDDEGCANAEDPWDCAKQVADAEMAEKPEGERLGMTEESTVGETVGTMRSLHANDWLDLSLPLVLRKDYSPEKRGEYAKKGWALADGSYPIADREDLMDAIHSFGRAPESKREQVKAHIRKRAKELGALENVSEEWGGKKDSGMEKKSTADEEVTEPVESTPVEEPAPAETPAEEAEEPVEKSAPVLTERAKRRMAEAERDAQVARTADLNAEVKGPDGMFYQDWFNRPLRERTLGAQLTERALARAYDEAVENSVANGWTAMRNPVREKEYFFQRYVETPDGLILTRSILTRKVGTMDWKLRELSRGASLSLAVQIPADERRQGDPRPFDLLPSRGGPGSGFFGHAGRPGERGGSAPSEGGGGPSGSEGGSRMRPTFYGGENIHRPGSGRKEWFHRAAQQLASQYPTKALRQLQDLAQKELRAERPEDQYRAQVMQEMLTQAVGIKEFSDWQQHYPSWMAEEDEASGKTLAEQHQEARQVLDEALAEYDRQVAQEQEAEREIEAELAADELAEQAGMTPEQLEQVKQEFFSGGEAMLPNYYYSLTPSEGRKMAGADFGEATEQVREEFQQAGGYPGHIQTAIREGNVQAAKDYLKDAGLSSIARVIAQDWRTQGKGVNFAAKPYLEAMSSLDTMRDMYGADDATSVVAYFLANAGTWKGDTARVVKAELNRRLRER